MLTPIKQEYFHNHRFQEKVIALCFIRHCDVELFRDFAWISFIPTKEYTQQMNVRINYFSVISLLKFTR